MARHLTLCLRTLQSNKQFSPRIGRTASAERLIHVATCCGWCNSQRGMGQEFRFFAYTSSNHFNACGRCLMIQRLIFAYEQPNFQNRSNFSHRDSIHIAVLFCGYLFSTQIEKNLVNIKNPAEIMKLNFFCGKE